MEGNWLKGWIPQFAVFCLFEFCLHQWIYDTSLGYLIFVTCTTFLSWSWCWCQQNDKYHVCFLLDDKWQISHMFLVGCELFKGWLFRMYFCRKRTKVCTFRLDATESEFALRLRNGILTTYKRFLTSCVHILMKWFPYLRFM